MGMLIEGVWTEDDAQYRNSASGSFVRPPSRFDAQITTDGSSAFAAEPGRYHLFVSAGCPWAHRTLIVRTLKKLEDIISVSYAAPPSRSGWVFSEGVGGDLEPRNGQLPLHRVYFATDPHYSGRVTVPVLWDKRDRRIVNNESSQIIRMFNHAFDAWGDATVDLYPEALRDEIDVINARIYAEVNNGVYRCGFATSQSAYDEAFGSLFAALDWLDARLARQRYLCGDHITEADWRLYVTLIRFDIAYYSKFKCNRQRIHEFAHLSGYLRELYQWPGIAGTTDFDAIKRVYFTDPAAPARSIIPVGPTHLHFDAPHGRHGLSSVAA